MLAMLAENEYRYWASQAVALMLVDSFEVLDLSATYTHDLGRGMLTVRVYGTDVLEDGGRIARPFDAGAFAFADIVPRRTLGATIGYEF